MHEFELIKNYFQKLSKKSPSALNLNDDVFFDKKNKLVVSVDTYIAVSYTHLRAHETLMNLVCRLLLEKNTTAIW